METKGGEVQGLQRVDVDAICIEFKLCTILLQPHAASGPKDGKRSFTTYHHYHPRGIAQLPSVPWPPPGLQSETYFVRSMLACDSLLQPPHRKSWSKPAKPPP